MEKRTIIFLNLGRLAFIEVVIVWLRESCSIPTAAHFEGFEYILIIVIGRLGVVDCLLRLENVPC